MIIVLKLHSTDDEVARVEESVRELGYEPHTIRGEIRTVVACVGDETTHKSPEALETLPEVDSVVPIQKRYKLVSRDYCPDRHRVQVGNTSLGGPAFHVVAGPCSIETYDQTLETAYAVKASGATLFRGGAFKPRTSPYDFQGLGDEALDILARVKTEVGIPAVSEVLRASDIDRMIDVVDVFQIGTRNCLNYSLLEAVGSTGRPVFLKRGMSATVEEWLLAAEYLAKNGSPHIILCERGIRTFEKATRNTLDLSAVAVARLESNLPVFVDPSHAAGRRDLIPQLARAAVAVGADGLMVEVHPNPEEALSDAAQQLTPEMFTALMDEIAPFIQAAGREMAAPTEVSA